MRKLLLIAMLIIVSCAPKQISGTLDAVDSCIESHPDSALILLESIKLPSLASHEIQARHALLYTITLDKNYIDLTSDSIIAPAVRYYTRRGSVDNRFKTLYYLGRIRQNVGDKESALDCFIKANDLSTEVKDTAALARCYSAQAEIYSDFYDYENAIEANRKAANLFLAIGNVNSYLNRVLQESFCWWAMNDVNRMKVSLEETRKYKGLFNDNLRGTYYSMEILYEMEVGDVSQVFAQYIQGLPEEKLNWKLISKVFTDKGDFDSAEKSMNKFCRYNKDYKNDIGYHALMLSLCDSVGAYEKAIEHYQRYLHLSDSTNSKVYYQNLKLVQDRHDKEKTILEQKNNNLVLFIILTIVAGLLIISVVFTLKYIKESKILRGLYSAAEKEKQTLERMLESPQIIDSEINSILSERMELLNEIVLNQGFSITSISSRTKEKIDTLLNDTKEYLSTIGMTYVVKNPKVVSFLKTRGLTTWEIGYCCLYVMGYNAKEISGIMHNNQVYKVSSRIREKLGLEGGKVRLETYLKNLFAQR